MNRTTSIYLDLIRGVAALLVFFHHVVIERVIGSDYALLGDFGEDAVIMFFVLSGYVISNVVAEKETCPRDYFISRFARLYSVVVPVLLLTVVFDYIGKHADFSLYQGRAHDSFGWMRALVSLTFSNQFWTFDIHYYSNAPFWSISYEFWYYVFFGVATFIAGWIRWGLLCLIAIVVGPLILLLMPVWWLGVYIHGLNARYSFSSRSAWALFVLPIVAYTAYRHWSVGAHLVQMTDSWVIPFLDPMQLHKARVFMHDYVVGFFIGVHLIGANALAVKGELRLDFIERPIRYIASYTFSIYLLHYPLLLCLVALSPWPTGDVRRGVMVIVGCLFLVWLLGSVTERKKYLWKRYCVLLWDAASKRAYAPGLP